MSELEKFKKEKRKYKKAVLKRNLGYDFIKKTADTNYTYNFSWLVVPLFKCLTYCCNSGINMANKTRFNN